MFNLSDDNKRWLAHVRENFHITAQKIFEATYLLPFDLAKTKTNLYELPVERISHGAQHASRVAAYIPLLVNWLRSIGHPEAMALTEDEITLLQLAALYHDAARQSDKMSDVWEEQSAVLLSKYLQSNGVDERLAKSLANIIRKKDQTSLLGKLLQSADSLDIMRCKPTLKIERISIYHDIKINKQARKTFFELIFDIRALIAAQYDLKNSCNVTLEGKKIYSAISATRTAGKTKLKQRYEQAKNCYQTVTEDFYHFKRLNQFFNQNALQPTQDLTELATLITPDMRYKKALGTTEPVFIKTISSDEDCFFRDFCEGITRHPQQKVTHSLRRGNQKRFTVYADGPMERTKKKPHQFEDKEFFSKHQSTTMVLLDAQCPAFGLRGKAGTLVGVLIYRADVHINRMFLYDRGTVNRPYDHYTLEAATEYYKKVTNPNNPTLFGDERIFKEVIRQQSHKYNEVLAYLRWNCETSKIGIFSDTIESRWLAVDRARILHNYVNTRAIHMGANLSPNYESPIIFYLPDSPKHFTYYTPAQQAKDKNKAEKIYANVKKRLKKYRNKDYEFLLVLGDEKIKEALDEMLPRGIPLLLKILRDGYVHIALSLLERAPHSFKLENLSFL